MAQVHQFLGKLEGKAGVALRNGSKDSGIRAALVSRPQGLAIEVELSHKDGKDHYSVALASWPQGQTPERQVIASGTLAGSPYLNLPCRELAEVLAAKGEE